VVSIVNLVMLARFAPVLSRTPGKCTKHTATESDSVDIAVSRLSSHQLSSEHIDLSINGCNCV